VLENPLAIDRRLRDAALVRARFRQKLRRGTAEEHAFEHAGARIDAELWEELRSGGADDPFGPALVRWAFLLHEEHTLVSLDQELARAWHADTHALDQPVSGTFTLAELRAQALADRRGGREHFFRAFLAESEHAGELALRRWERRAEHASELRLVSLDALEGVTPELARAPLDWVSATSDAFDELELTTPVDLVRLALGEDSRADWPAHLSTRSLADLFDEAAWFRHVTLSIAEPPARLGASSFLRALDELGRALRGAFASSSLPFSARDPFELEAATWGALFALLPLGESFATRRLGVTRARLADHRRALTRVLLLSVREAAFRALLRAPALEGPAAARRAFQELGERVFRVELPARAAGALLCPKPASVHDFAALALAADLDVRLTETHDDDWYRNPRAVAELREGAAAAPRAEISPEHLASGLATLAKRLATSV
jgi:hypothetical protein